LEKKSNKKKIKAITDKKERQILIKLAKERNMNVQAITLDIVESVSRRPYLNKTIDQTGFLNMSQQHQLQQSMLSKTGLVTRNAADLFAFKSGQILNEDDKSRIDAIDWILYEPLQRIKLLEYANLTMRHFLIKRRNLDAAALMFAKIPNDTLATILSHYNVKHLRTNSSDESELKLLYEFLPLNIANMIKEYLCFKEYIVIEQAQFNLLSY
jgi:hypothetical protein